MLGAGLLLTVVAFTLWYVASKIPDRRTSLDESLRDYDRQTRKGLGL